MYHYLIVLLSLFPLDVSLKPLLSDLVEVEEMDITDINKGLDLFEGDILREPKTKSRVSRNAILETSQLWSNPVPYVFEDGLHMNTKGVILQAMEHFRLKSCVDFTPRQSEKSYLTIKEDSGCSSYVSRVFHGGQVISIAQECGHIGTVEHELLHALGFYHEQSRFDRDDYINVIWSNIQEEFKDNFEKLSPLLSRTFNSPYDFSSVTHYGKKYFSKNSGNTIITKLPWYQDTIGQRIEMSPTDVYKLNCLYNCSASIALAEHCSFCGSDICGMKLCKNGSAEGWRRVRAAARGPLFDHTNPGKTKGFFMHAGTASTQKGHSAWLETRTLRPTRNCHVQCLQFYFYHSGSDSDQLNIWMREFRGEGDAPGNLRLMAQIKGPPNFAWQFYKVPLNAAKPFQIVFEVRTGQDDSSGGFSIDDVNLSESECPHHVWEIKDFERRLTTAENNSYLLSPRMYSADGYSFQVAIVFRETHFGVYFRLVSGYHDSALQWPCQWRQVTVILLDKKPNLREQMSKQVAITTDPSSTTSDNPRKTGKLIRRDGENLYVNPFLGVKSFLTLEQIRSQGFLRGGTAVFLISMTDISPLQNKSSLPCPKYASRHFTTMDPSNHNIEPCDSA